MKTEKDILEKYRQRDCGMIISDDDIVKAMNEWATYVIGTITNSFEDDTMQEGTVRGLQQEGEATK